MAELKTKANKASVTAFLSMIEGEQKRADCRAIAKMMRDATGKQAKMWGAAIVGYDHMITSMQAVGQGRL